MSDAARAQRFADALTALEEGQPEQLLEQFAEGAELHRPQISSGPAATDTATFWEQYRSQFDQVQTEFSRVTEGGDEGVLEWRSRGRLATGREIDYAGVSLLTFDGDQVSRFATYYDTAAFLEPVA